MKPENQRMNTSLISNQLSEPQWRFKCLDNTSHCCGLWNGSDVNMTSYTDCNNEDVQPWEFFQVEQTIVLVILFIFIVISNSIVLVALKISHKNTRMTFFITQLALADLATAVFALLPDIIWKITIAFYGGNILCKLVRFLQSVATYASTYVLVALSLDRLDAIARPLNFHNSEFFGKALIAGAWSLAAVASFPMIFINNYGLQENIMQCWIRFPYFYQWKVYVTLHAILVFILPALIIAACYIYIVRTVWLKGNSKPFLRRFTSNQQNKNIKASSYKMETPKLLQNAPVEDDSSFNVSSCRSRGILSRARVKTIKMTLVIVIVFVICWSPFFVYNLLDVYDLLPVMFRLPAVSFFIQSLFFLNSVANPVIYCCFSSNIFCVDKSSKNDSNRRAGCCDGFVERVTRCRKQASVLASQTDYTGVTRCKESVLQTQIKDNPVTR